jgi:hypothetical protein
MDEQATPHTYEQAAAVLGIQAEAVRARLRRAALRRGPRTNDGRPTVLLGPADIATIRSGARPVVHPETSPESNPGPDGREIRALLDLLRIQLERAQAEADQARAALTAAQERWEARIDRLTADLTEERKVRLVEAEVHAQREADLRQAKVELDRLKARPWWQRIWRAG